MAHTYTEYIVVKEKTLEDLEASVAVKLAAGYELFGGVSVAVYPPFESPAVYQAMAK